MMDSFEMRRKNIESMEGMEIVEITPIILGGSPTEPQNKMLLTRQQHFEFVCYWNSVIRKLRSEKA